MRWVSGPRRRILENRTYTGVQFYGENRYRKVAEKKRAVTPRPPEEVIRIEGFTPQIISEELFDLVQERLRVRQANVTKSDRMCILTGIARCLTCGALWRGTVWGGGIGLPVPRHGSDFGHACYLQGAIHPCGRI